MAAHSLAKKAAIFSPGDAVLTLFLVVWAMPIALAACSDDPPADPSPVVSGPDAGEDHPIFPEDSGVADAKPLPDGDAAPASGFCQLVKAGPNVRFCDDFDDVGRTEPKTHWDVQTVLNGIPELDTSIASSKPASFRASTAPVDLGESAHVHLRVTSKGSPASFVKLSFAVFVPTATFASGAIAIATLDVSQNHFFTLFLRDRDPDAPAVTLEEVAGAVTTRHVLSKPLPSSQWIVVTIAIDLAASKASVLFGSQSALDGASITSAPSSDPTIRVGAVYVYGPADAFEASFDDVVLEHD